MDGGPARVPGGGVDALTGTAGAGANAHGPSQAANEFAATKA